MRLLALTAASLVITALVAPAAAADEPHRSDATMLLVLDSSGSMKEKAGRAARPRSKRPSRTARNR